jgi:hypothetical protein
MYVILNEGLEGKDKASLEAGTEFQGNGLVYTAWVLRG